MAYVQEMSEVFQAAKRGRWQEVEQLLRRHRIPANTRHYWWGQSLVCFVADVRTSSHDMDRDLGRVLVALIELGWSLNERRLPTRENALHLLAGQPKWNRTSNRLRLFMDRAARDRSTAMMLTERDSCGRLPEDCAPPGEFGQRLRLQLTEARVRYTNL